MSKKKELFNQPDMFDAPLSPVVQDLSALISNLNAAQQQAVLHKTGPLLIVAGAGTGKTSVLTQRIAHLILSKTALPSEILALTFTDKAAGEMEERIDKILPYGFNDVAIATFHSFGDKILREYALDLGLSPDIKVLTQAEAVVFLSQHLFDLDLQYYRPLSDPTRFVDSLLKAFSRAKDEDVTAQEFVAFAQKKLDQAKEIEDVEQAQKMLEVARAYGTYQELKMHKGFIDFGDQVTLALQLLRSKPSVLKKVQDQFKYVLVDEFQDTNYAQFELVKLISAPHKNVTVVGDDDQSIYKFRGACLSNILTFKQTYPQAKEVVLLENYRSTQAILDAAYKLIQHNNPNRLEYQNNISKFLRAQTLKGPAVKHIAFETLFAESEYVAQNIAARLKDGMHAKDCAILVRTNNAAEAFIKSLNLLSIPWRFSGNAGLYEQEEIRIALSFLRLMNHWQDNASLYYLAQSSMYNLSSVDLSVLSWISGQQNRPLLDVFKVFLKDPQSLVYAEKQSTKKVLEVSEESKKTIEKLVSDLDHFLKISNTLATGFLLYQFFERSGFLEKLVSVNDYKSVQQAQNLHRFFEMIKKFSQVAQYDRAHYFVEYAESLRLASDDPSSAQISFDDSAVQILTVHAAKGLEFDLVYMVGLEQGHFPTTKKSDSIDFPWELAKEVLPQENTHVQEERRLFYVGLTRAKRELILCSAQDHGKKRLWKTSQFVLETMDKEQAAMPAVKTDPIASLRVFSQSPQSADLTFVPSAKSELTLSASALDQYISCPMQYKLSSVLKIPVPKHHTAVFGTAIHGALEQYHHAKKNREIFTLDQLQESFKRYWQSEGFLSREHEEQRFAEGLKILKEYYKDQEKSAITPTLIEESFKMNLGSVRIKGRWDRVDVNDQESVVIDYKTKDVKSQEDADKKAKESLQLVVYALAFENRFGKLPDKMVLHFVKNNFVGTLLPSAKVIDKAAQKLEEAANGIVAQKFDPQPGYQCNWCAFEKICPAAERG